VISEGDETPPRGPLRGRERDLLAERRARRAGVGDPELVRRAEAAEVLVDALEAHLIDLRRRLAEAVRERERATELLVEHERELRRVKQREYAEQQLRVEAEDNLTGLRREHRAELDRLHRRVQEAWAAERQAEERRTAAEQLRAAAERHSAALTARLAGVQESVVRLQHGMAALQAAAVDLRGTLGRERQDARARIAELEHALAQAARPEGQSSERVQDTDEQARREEMTEALAAAVQRLRARIADVGETPEDAPAPQRTAAAPVRQRPPHKHSMSLIARVRTRRKYRRERRAAAAQPPTMQSP
jgi:chromosome segregation ATPase